MMGIVLGKLSLPLSLSRFPCCIMLAKILGGAFQLVLQYRCAPPDPAGTINGSSAVLNLASRSLLNLMFFVFVRETR